MTQGTEVLQRFTVEGPSKPAVTPVKTHWFINLDFWGNHYFALLWVPFWGELVCVGGQGIASPQKRPITRARALKPRAGERPGFYTQENCPPEGRGALPPRDAPVA